MRLLIDESLPRELATHLQGHQSLTVPEAGWASKSNGELLRLASGDFDALITADQNLEYQQNYSQYDLRILVLVAPTNRIQDLTPLIPKLLEAIEEVRPGELVRVAA